MTALPLWRPGHERIQQARLTDFVAFLKTRKLSPPSHYDALHAWSVDNKEAFWLAIWEYFQVKGDLGGAPFLRNANKMPGAQWFPEAKINFAENLLKHRNGKHGDEPAIIVRGEDGRREELSFNELYRQVAKLAQFLKANGVGPGDRVAAFIPNCAEAVIGMLATASLGGVWSSCSPDFGLNGVIDRFGQIAPKLLIACRGYNYNGKVINTMDRVQDIVGKLPALHGVVWVNYLKNPQAAPTDLSGVTATSWEDIVNTPGESAIEFVRSGFAEPLYIMYSSGTTGQPKCIVHGQGGTLLQHLKELGLHTDLKPGDRIFYYTTCGWMMWNWLVSSLAIGATLVLYDGSPFHPSPSHLFDIAQEENINVFGSSAKFYAACEKNHLKPAQTHRLDSLRAMLSTGSPLAHESFDYIYRDVKADVCLSSISGGTDIVSCFALGCPTLPVYRGELQCIGLGMDVEFVDDSGRSLAQGKGELVCKSPFPSMPVGFWNDEDGARFHSAYFSSIDNIWAHGDYGEFISHAENGEVVQKGVIIHGRSDAVLNPGGVRIGTAEIYRQVEKIEEVLESIAVGQAWGDDERVILFVKTRPGVDLNDELCSRITQTIRKNTTPRHVPAKIIQIADIPRTISGKIVELAVKNVIHGKEVKNKDALANPEALQLFEDLEELRG
ncbi:acetoacetate--CoA ligase [Hahella sp. NBU794]|uniref:acetoacetate--CoA ligase n=1 Tax=Hahella sp. NBU794 TaxID=3422590 RepID=UPI003D6EEA11